MNKTTLLSYMPKYYRDSKVIDNLNDANAKELNIFLNKIKGTLNQFFIDTSDFTLNRWEKEVGIRVNDNHDMELRRSRIKAKIRGQGTTTKALIENTTSSFNGGESKVIENFNDYFFRLKFNNYYRVPNQESITEIYKILEEIKPAHLDFNHTFTYNWWTREEVKNKTWANAGTWQKLRDYEEVI